MGTSNIRRKSLNPVGSPSLIIIGEAEFTECVLGSSDRDLGKVVFSTHHCEKDLHYFLQVRLFHLLVVA